jgi:hypothetical protein
MIKRIIPVVFLAMFLFSGCGHIKTGDERMSVCDKLETGDSLICDLSKKIGQSPEMIATILRIANVSFLSVQPEKAQMVHDYIVEIEVVLNQAKGQGILYPVVRKYVVDKYCAAPQIVQANIILLKGLVEEYTDFKTRALTDIDIEMILFHLNDQKQLLAPFLKK